MEKRWWLWFWRENNSDKSTNNQTIPIGTTIYSRISDITIILAIDEDDYDDVFKEYKYYFDTYYHGYVLDHKNESTPLHKINDKYIHNQISINLKDPIIWDFNWKIIKYKKNKKQWSYRSR